MKRLEENLLETSHDTGIGDDLSHKISKVQCVGARRSAPARWWLRVPGQRKFTQCSEPGLLLHTCLRGSFAVHLPFQAVCERNTRPAPLLLLPLLSLGPRPPPRAGDFACPARSALLHLRVLERAAGLPANSPGKCGDQGGAWTRVRAGARAAGGWRLGDPALGALPSEPAPRSGLWRLRPQPSSLPAPRGPRALLPSNFPPCILFWASLVGERTAEEGSGTPLVHIFIEPRSHFGLVERMPSGRASWSTLRRFRRQSGAGGPQQGARGGGQMAQPRCPHSARAQPASPRSATPRWLSYSSCSWNVFPTAVLVSCYCVKSCLETAVGPPAEEAYCMDVHLGDGRE
ncbi:uncharacterized protein [Oryctolagus cuniculus]|uniref:uncharacterized protein n=1 Tax=Oryctolagus cuniculus TaxID=9986 RepID=UPI00387A3E13